MVINQERKRLLKAAGNNKCALKTVVRVERINESGQAQCVGCAAFVSKQRRYRAMTFEALIDVLKNADAVVAWRATRTSRGHTANLEGGEPRFQFRGLRSGGGRLELRLSRPTIKTSYSRRAILKWYLPFPSIYGCRPKC